MAVSSFRSGSFLAISTVRLLVCASALLAGARALGQSPSNLIDLPDAPLANVDQNVVGVAEVDREIEEPQQAAAQQAPSTTPPASAYPQSSAPPTPSPANSSTQSQQSIAPGDLKKEEQQRIFGVIPAFNAVNSGNSLPLTPRQKFQLMFKSTTDPYIFAFAAVTAGIGQAQNSHAGYGQGVQGYAKRYGANYVDTADGNFWGNAVLPTLWHEDPRYFRLGEGTVTHRILYSMSTAFWCKRDNGTHGPNYANVIGNLIAGGISNAYYPSEDRGVGQTFQSAATVTAEGMIGAALIEFWPDIVQHYERKRQAKLDAAATAARNSQTTHPEVAPQ